MQIAIGTKIEELTARFNMFNQELLTFIQSCDQTKWTKITTAEGWPVCVTARHIVVAHYPVAQWLQMLVEGQPLPPVTMAMVDQMNAQHAQERRGCTQDEVLELLHINHADMVSYLKTLNEDDLEQTGHVTLFDTTMSVGEFVAFVSIDGSINHLESMRAVV
ncbi:MAG: DinB family protein [Chloroflexota bacterium]